MFPIAARFWVARWFRAPRQDFAACVKLCSLVTYCDCCVLCHPCPCCVPYSRHRSRDCPIASARLLRRFLGESRRSQDAIRRFQRPLRPCAASDSNATSTSPNADNDESVLHPVATARSNVLQPVAPGPTARSNVSQPVAPGCGSRNLPLFRAPLSILTRYSIS